jgi:hypothetical protein
VSGLTQAAIQELRARLRGPLIAPGDAEYASLRRVYNGMIDRYPRLIARCRDVAEVISAANFGRDAGLTVAVRRGGHNGAGLGTCDGGLVIDLSLLNGTRVDPVARTVRVEGGSTWGDVDHATHTFGLATPSGVLSTTGVGGLTLGGGLGHLTHQCGLSIDNRLEVDVVLADGSFVTANADLHSDLFWAVRGGGGNFGVVTSFLFRLHPITTVVGGPMLWHLGEARELMRWYRDVITDAPDEINGFFAFLKVPPGPPFPEICTFKRYVGSSGATQDRRQKRRRPLRRSGTLPEGRWSTLSVHFRIQHYKACSITCTHPASNGSGGRTSSRADRRSNRPAHPARFCNS